MEFCDSKGNPLQTGKPYNDLERRAYSNNLSTLCEITSFGKEYFELKYADGGVKRFLSPESLVSRAKALVPVKKNDLIKKLSHLKLKQTWLEKQIQEKNN